MGLAFGGILLVAPSGGAGVLDASWNAPTTNGDGSPLTDLASYRVYYGPATACPGAVFSQVASPTTSPGPDQTVSVRLKGLTTGALYFVSVTAVNMSGDESPCSIGASAVAHDHFSVSPTGIVSFGDVNVGSFADQVFTVQNTRGGTVSGSASASAPFSIVSGSPFRLVGDGATQAVTVRFTPTASATVSTNVAFTADGDTISRLVTGIGVDFSADGNAISGRTDDPVIADPLMVAPAGSVAQFKALGFTFSAATNPRGLAEVRDTQGHVFYWNASQGTLESVYDQGPYHAGQIITYGEVEAPLATIYDPGSSGGD